MYDAFDLTINEILEFNEGLFTFCLTVLYGNSGFENLTQRDRFIELKH